jgi:selenoprotein W-related protein
MDEKLTIQIEYCVPWNYLFRAAWTAEELLHDYGDKIQSLTLVPSGGGRFEVTVNDRLIYSKAREGRFPDLNELKQQLHRFM